MGILSRLDAITGRDAAPAAVGVPEGAGTPALAPNDGSFSQGLRQGMTAAGGQLHALAGGVGAALGAQDFAKAQYAQSAAAEQLAAQQAPEVSDWRQVTGAPDLSTGLRRAGSYVAGLAGQSAPAIGLGLGAGAATALTGGGALPAFAAGTAAIAPLEVGGALQRQQHDPVALANNDAGTRLGTAALEGVGRAAAMNAVPQLMGGKLLGKVAATETLPGIVAEGVGGNALAGAAAEKISTAAQNSLNPNRDTSGDNARMVDAAVSGGALGVPFAGMGAVGHALHGDGVAAPAVEPGATPEAAPAAKPSLFDRVKGVFDKPTESAAERVAKGQDVIDPDALRAAPFEQQVEMINKADEQRVVDTKSWYDELTQDGKLSPEKQDALKAAASDFGDRANQAVIAGLKVAQDAGSKALDMASAFYDAATKHDEKTSSNGAPMPLKSEVSAGTSRAIGAVVKPLLAEKFPQLVENDKAMSAVTGGLQRVMDGMQKTGKVDPDVVEHLHNWFGADTPDVLAKLHDAVLGGDDAASEKYFSAVNKMTDDLADTSALHDKVLAALPPDLQKDATPEQVDQMVKHLREYADGTGTDNKPAARVAFEQRQLEDGLRAHFGANTGKLLEAFKQDADARRAKAVPEPTPDERLTGEDGLIDHPDAGVTTEQDTARQYFGGGTDKENPQFMLSEAAHRRIYGNEASQAARVKAAASAANPDMHVSAISAHQYAQEHGIPKAQLMDMTNGAPDDHVMVKAEGLKRDGITWGDVDRLRLDTHRYPESKSRIDTEDGVVLDAHKVMNMYAQEHMLPRDAQDAANPMYRLRRQFSEAIGALSDHLGENVHVPDETVVARRGGRDVTWGELQKTGRVKETGPTDALYGAREAAVKAGDTAEVKAIDAKLDAHVLRANDPADELADGSRKTNAVNNERADMQARERLAATAAELGAARTKAEAEIAKNGKLRDDAGNLRALTAKEQALIKAHGKLTDRYNELAYKLGEKRFDEGALEHSKVPGIKEDGKIKAMPTWLTKESTAPAEADPSGNVHAAAREHGDALGGVFAASRNMEAGPEGNMLHASNFEPEADPFNARNPDGTLPPNVQRAIDGRVQQFELGKSAAARAIGEKGRHLLSVLKQMKTIDQAELASIVKEKSGTERAASINALYAKYKGLEPIAKKPSAFVDRVVGKGDVAPAVKAIKASTEPRDIQRAVDALIPHQHDASARAVLEAANERISRLIEKDPSVTYSMQQVDPQSSSTSKVQGDVRAHIEQVLGKTVDVEFAKMLHAGEFVRDDARTLSGMAPDLIRISTHSLDPMGVAYHESLHALFAKLHDEGLMHGTHPLTEAASSPRVVRQLETLLAGEHDALAQLSSPAERAAYMYQFWAAGKLKLGGKPEGILAHIADFFRKTLGIWTNDARAEHIMQYFHSGEYAQNIGDRGAVASALLAGTNERVNRFMEMARPIGQLANAVAATGDQRLRGSGIDALVKLADKVYSPLYGEQRGSDPGYMPAARAKRGELMNQLAADLGGHDPAVVTDALTAMQRGEKGATPKERIVIATLRKTLDNVFDYMRERGVKVSDLGYGKDYFPRVWDPQVIMSKEQEFRDMLERYKATGEFKGSVDQVMATLTRTDGSDLQAETVKPGMQSAKQRVLAFVSGRDAEPFLQKDLYQTLNNYITQATRRAEWAHRFRDDGAELHNLLHDAREQGATPEQLQLASDYLQGVDGTLGDHIDPKLRRAFGNMIVYQNLRLLPLALFSSLIDPMGIVVRGGTVGDAFGAMKRGFSEIPKGFKKNPVDDHWTTMSEQMGVIDGAVLRHALGSSYSQGMTSNLGRKVNDTLFKYNLMEQFNTSMRVAATKAAVGFLGRHADGTASVHSARWLAELGFKPGEITVKNGEPLLTRAQFEARGMTAPDAQRAADRMTLAVNKWVDGAILRPNAAHKPVWMNDPHFALIAHLKPFVYSFQETILKRVANEVRFGNVGPAYSLAAYVPFMLAADTMKGMIQGGGEQPDWKKGWGASDYLFYEMQRAGLFGVGQFGLDAAKDLHRGGLGVGALVGPTAEQLGEAVNTVAGTEQFKTFALHAMPANTLIDAGESAMTNAID